MSGATHLQGVLFDKDGTLFDFAKTWEAWASAFIARLATGPDHATRIGAAIGFDTVLNRFVRGSIVIAGAPDEVAAALTPEVPGHSLQSLIAIINEEAARAPQVEAVPLAPFLAGLRADRLRLGVATNDAEGPARAHLGAAGVTDLFDFIVGYDSGYGSKPGPGQLLGFAEAMRLAPEACVMVGDSLHDLHAGRAAGFSTVGVLTGYADADELRALADAVLPNIGHLPNWLSERSG
jgi:phosphoglycolate phosphatase